MIKNTQVDKYWQEHTVNSLNFATPEESLQYLKWRSLKYPFFHDLMELYNADEDWTVLDYGCGPGNDLVGYSCLSKAKKVIGVDISDKAFYLAKKRLLLHNIDVDTSNSKVQLIKISDALSSEGSVLKNTIANESIDHIYCQGVLHHVTEPTLILKEFYRILKKGSKACIMVYNRNSIFYHLYVGYMKRVLAGMEGTTEEIFTRSTDGSECPISYTTIPEEYIPICEEAGFSVEYRGGYLCDLEIDLVFKYLENAKLDFRCDKEHRNFLKKIKINLQAATLADGSPYYEGKLAGIGGVYVLHKEDK